MGREKRQRGLKRNVAEDQTTEPCLHYQRPVKGVPVVHGQTPIRLQVRGLNVQDLIVVGAGRSEQRLGSRDIIDGQLERAR